MSSKRRRARIAQNTEKDTLVAQAEQATERAQRAVNENVVLKRDFEQASKDIERLSRENRKLNISNSYLEYENRRLGALVEEYYDEIEKLKAVLAQRNGVVR